MAYAIRHFEDGDAEQLAGLTTEAIRTIGIRRYSDTQVAAWAARHIDAQRFVERHTDGDMILVAVDAADRPVAYALLERNGHLDMLYCHPRHSRQGLSDHLLAEAEQEARLNEIRLLYTEASELARPAFERAGYVVKHRRNFEIAHAGKAVPIHNFAMEKQLD